MLYSFKCNCTANVFLAFYHFRVAVAEYAIDGVPEMNMRLFLRKYPSEEANDSTDVNHHTKINSIDDNNHQVAITV